MWNNLIKIQISVPVCVRLHLDRPSMLVPNFDTLPNRNFSCKIAGKMSSACPEPHTLRRKGFSGFLVPYRSVSHRCEAWKLLDKKTTTFCRTNNARLGFSIESQGSFGNHYFQSPPCGQWPFPRPDGGWLISSVPSCTLCWTSAKMPCAYGLECICFTEPPLVCGKALRWR